MKLFCKNCDVVRWCGILRSILQPAGHTIRVFQCGECNHRVVTGEVA